MIKKQVDTILDTNMNRKEFLKHVGVAVLAVAGVSSVLSALGQLGPAVRRQESSRGYGMTQYGR